MELKLILPKQKEKVVKYLTRKEAWNYGFLRYNLFKKMIRHIIKSNNNYEIRRLFLYLVDEDIFIKQKTNVRSYMYLFKNPKASRVENKTITISFD